ncbi:MAG TPA: bacterioferritin-associated ferredoxin [Woeseiaceae bacterium]|nr:bacterioferritin-associated ferredoxin [Woeseiaceae bacterium]
MYICICNAVTDKQIRRAAASGVDNLYELREALGVASCCGSCADEAESILREANSESTAGQPRLYIPSAA